MNEVMQVRAASWAARIKLRNDSGLIIKERCAANRIHESVCYYWLNQLRKMALDNCETLNLIKNNAPVFRTFAQISAASAILAPYVTISIRHGDTVVDMSSEVQCLSNEKWVWTKI